MVWVPPYKFDYVQKNGIIDKCDALCSNYNLFLLINSMNKIAILFYSFIYINILINETKKKKKICYIQASLPVYLLV